MKKRNRACEECHRLKIKCDVNPNLGGACGRCSRNNLDCTPTAPRLQRDRIQELEAQVSELENTLRSQSGSSRTPSQSPSSLLLEDTHDAILSLLDARIPLSKQQELLHMATHQASAVWPVIVLDSLHFIRQKSPVLLLSVMVYCVSHAAQGTDLEVHDELVRETVRILADEVISRGQRSLELVQALLITAFWNKTTRKGDQGSCYQLAQLATDMAIDLGIAGFSLQPSPVAFFSHHGDPTSLEARRTWLSCFVLLCSSSLQTRRPHATPWDTHHQECLSHLETHGLPSDLLLCHIVRISQLIQEIADQLCLCRLGTFLDSNSYETHVTMQALKHKVDAWAAQIPPTHSSSQTLKIWYHLAMIHIHELVLHTPTNKPSFAAPFIPNRIPVADFPKPTSCIPPLVSALDALIQHCHAVVDIAGEMDPAVVIALPAFSFAPAVLYALFVLVTCFAAATDPANTYGAYLTGDRFCIELYGSKLGKLAAGMREVDPTMSCYTTRMFDATNWLTQWHRDFNMIVERYKANLSN